MKEVSATLTRLFPKLFGLVLVAGIVGWGVLVMYGAARDDWYGDWRVFVGSAIALNLMLLFLSPNWPTLHNIFAKRLARSFDSVSIPMRVCDSASAVHKDEKAKPINALATWQGLAQVSKPNRAAAVPELIMCCAQQRDGITSGGLRAETFTISPHWVRQGRRS